MTDGLCRACIQPLPPAWVRAGLLVCGLCRSDAWERAEPSFRAAYPGLPARAMYSILRAAPYDMLASPTAVEDLAAWLSSLSDHQIREIRNVGVAAAAAIRRAFPPSVAGVGHPAWVGEGVPD